MVLHQFQSSYTYVFRGGRGRGQRQHPVTSASPKYSRSGNVEEPSETIPAALPALLFLMHNLLKIRKQTCCMISALSVTEQQVPNQTVIGSIPPMSGRQRSLTKTASRHLCLPEIGGVEPMTVRFGACCSITLQCNRFLVRVSSV